MLADVNSKSLLTSLNCKAYLLIVLSRHSLERYLHPLPHLLSLARISTFFMTDVFPASLSLCRLITIHIAVFGGHLSCVMSCISEDAHGDLTFFPV